MSAGEPALWLQLANEDVAMAGRAFDQGIYRQTCFHAQQAVEKALKALLLARQGTYPRTHSLEDLLAFDTSGELSEWEEACQRLSQFYLTTRYVDALPGGSWMKSPPRMRGRLWPKPGTSSPPSAVE